MKVADIDQTVAALSNALHVLKPYVVDTSPYLLLS
jgi:hypothetical protein